MIAVLVFLVFYFLFILRYTGYEPAAVVFMVIILLLIASFTTLTVMINEKYLRIRFGYGIFRKKFKLEDIVSAKVVKNHWYYGWGIKFSVKPRAWIFNVSGFDAVQIEMENGKLYRIGTDEPEDLEQAILQSI